MGYGNAPAITRDELRRQVSAYLNANEQWFDVDGIVKSLEARHGLVPLATIAGDDLLTLLVDNVSVPPLPGYPESPLPDDFRTQS